MNLLGFDIGGTKCAVITGKYVQQKMEISKKAILPTNLKISPECMIDILCAKADELLGKASPDAIGISCGGPLNSAAGIIINPPNLPGWTNVNISEMLHRRYGSPVYLQNDANACALAEWKFGAGRGCRNMIFLTFGTGLGAGLILDGSLYSGTNGMAGEVGHIRLSSFGPVGYGKCGSFEGFCSGGGLAQLGYTIALEQIQQGRYPACFKAGMKPYEITAKSIADAAAADDKAAIEVYKICGEYLGRGLSILIDILNPQKIIIGSIFARSHDLLWNEAKAVIEKEALPLSAAVCEIIPAALRESLGDYAALAAALYHERG